MGAAGKLIERVTKPLKTAIKGVKEPARPLTYSQARDFYTNITSMTPEEISTLKDPIRRQMGAVARALKDDIGDAAAKVGRAGDYYAAMKDYANAANLQRAGQALLKYVGIPIAKYGVPGGAAVWGFEQLKGMGK